jgi:hypothetical protein
MAADVEQKIKAIGDVLDNFYMLKEALQTDLISFTNDRNYPLDKRYEVWEKYCDKNHHGWTIHEGQFGILGKYVDDCCGDGDMQRGRTYDYDWFLTRLVENEIYPEDVVKETLISMNFGSFCFDW